MKKKIYLAGPMAGITFDQANNWRDYVTSKLDGEIMECFNPTRGESLVNGVFSALAHGANPCNTVGAITGRDRFDVQTSDLVFMNVIGAKTVSIGTTVELGWADIYRKPLVLCMEESGNPHDSIHFRGLATYLVNDLDSGIMCARNLLLSRAGDAAKPNGPSIIARHF